MRYGARHTQQHQFVEERAQSERIHIFTRFVLSVCVRTLRADISQTWKLKNFRKIENTIRSECGNSWWTCCGRCLTFGNEKLRGFWTRDVILSIWCASTFPTVPHSPVQTEAVKLRYIFNVACIGELRTRFILAFWRRLFRYSHTTCASAGGYNFNEKYFRAIPMGCSDPCVFANVRICTEVAKVQI